jgi:hypothetical protein
MKRVRKAHRCSVLAIGLAAWVLAGPAIAAEAPDAGPGEPLAALAFLIGKWEERPAGDPEGRVNHLEMTWDLGETVIRRSEMRSDDGKRWRVTGLISWNAVSGQIEFQEHADWGNFVRGTIEILAEGEVRRHMEVAYPDGSTARWRTTVRSTGEDSFETETQRLVDGEWQGEWGLAGRRAASFPWEVSAVGTPQGYLPDNELLDAFEPFLGIWGPSPEEAEAGEWRMVMEWGIPRDTVRFAEYRRIEGEWVQANEALVGYHYGRQRIEFLEFARDGIMPFEVMNEGYFEVQPKGDLVRRYRSFDPDMSSREYRETFELLEPGRRLLTIEYRDNDGHWQPWPRGPFEAVLYDSLEGKPVK